MYQYTPTGIRFKIFLKEKNTEDLLEEPNDDKKYFRTAPLTGDKAKEFYEDILKESSSSSGGNSQIKLKLKPKPKPKPKPKLESYTKFKNSDLLQLAQNNDVKSLREFLLKKNDYDINITDDFGWTSLMCAACAGAKEAVEILLEKGADPYRCDRQGNTASKLAKWKNHKNIVRMLENHGKEKREFGSEIKEPSEPFFCPNCKDNVTMSKNKHETSTLHLFNCPFKTSTFYGIPESNKGFQLLLKEGWDKEKGLGRDGTGRKFPIKAVMKKDRTGIGGVPPIHERNDHHTEKYENKKIKLYNSWKDKDFEKKFRLEFS